MKITEKIDKYLMSDTLIERADYAKVDVSDATDFIKQAHTIIRGIPKYKGLKRQLASNWNAMIMKRMDSEKYKPLQWDVLIGDAESAADIISMIEFTPKGRMYRSDRFDSFISSFRPKGVSWASQLSYDVIDGKIKDMAESGDWEKVMGQYVKWTLDKLEMLVSGMKV